HTGRTLRPRTRRWPTRERESTQRRWNGWRGFQVRWRRANDRHAAPRRRTGFAALVGLALQGGVETRAGIAARRARRHTPARAPAIERRHALVLRVDDGLSGCEDSVRDRGRSYLLAHDGADGGEISFIERHRRGSCISADGTS